MKIRFLATVFSELMDVLQWDGKERAAFVLCNRSSSGKCITLLPHMIFAPEESDYLVRTAGYCEVNKSFINLVFNEAVRTQSDVIKVHTHPPGYPAVYSPVDEQSEPEFLAHVASKIEGILLASLVFNGSSDSVDGWYFDRATSELMPIEKVTIIGEDHLGLLTPFRSPLKDKALDPVLSRTATAFGEGRVKKFGNLDIAVIGASGIGAPIIELIARDRPKSLIICDPDHIERTNLNRLIGATEKDIGRNKADHYAELVKSISPDTEVTAYPISFYEPAAQTASTQADIAIGGVDSGARHAINQFCMAHLIPYFDFGASIVSDDGNPSFIGGQIYSVIPGKDVCLACSGVFDSLLSEYLPPKIRAANARQGYVNGDDSIISPLVAHLDFIIASLGYYEVLKYAIGLPWRSSFKVYFDQIDDKISRSNCKTEKCAVCRSDGYLGKGDKVPFLRPQVDTDDSAILSLMNESSALRADGRIETDAGATGETQKP